MSFFVRNVVTKRPGSMSIRRCTSEAKAVKVKPPKAAQPEPVKADAYKSPNAELGATHKVSNTERYFLVWTKKYPSLASVPAHVSQDTMERCRNLVRIRVNLTLIVLCLFGAFTAMYSGRKAAERGESVVKTNIEWHKAYNEQKKQQQE